MYFASKPASRSSIEQRGLDMETAVLRVESENPRRWSFSQRMLAEGVLDRGDAFVGREQPLDVAARQEESAGATRVCAWLAG
ncbi:MAG: hypothetical protein JWN13_5700 [Betaproteobacteria bacterium]|jgi:hypothetical protein|nr:hypothetical protein [Betaproteobacteria bacterium]